MGADFRAMESRSAESNLVHCNTVLSASSVVFRRGVWKIARDEEMVLCGDWKVWASMALTGGTIFLRWRAAELLSISRR